MKATARRISPAKFTHRVQLRDHELVVDEPRELGGDDEGPTPQELLAASLAACTAITLEMYALRKGWKLDQIEVDCSFGPTERGSPTPFELVIRVPDTCSEDQLDRIAIIAARCPVHRVLESGATFTQRLELAPASGSGR